MKFSELKSLSAAELNKLGSSELRESYQTVRKIVGSRVRTFAKHGEEDAIPAHLRSGLSSAKGRTDEEILQSMKEALAWTRGKRSTFRSFMESEEDRRRKLQEAMPDLDLSDRKKMKDFTNFMNDVASRYKEMNKSISGIVKALYSEAERLNINKKALLKNLEYWIEHVEDLEKSDPIRTRKSRELQPSEYARKLGLEKITGGRRK